MTPEEALLFVIELPGDDDTRDALREALRLLEDRERLLADAMLLVDSYQIGYPEDGCRVLAEAGQRIYDRTPEGQQRLRLQAAVAEGITWTPK